MTECQKYAWTKLPNVCQYDYEGKKRNSWDKTAIFLSVWRQKKQKNNNNQRTKLSIYILDTIESESTTRFKNRSSDRTMTSD